MAMNRETKRLLQRQGQLGEDGSPAVKRRSPPPSRPVEKERRTPLPEFTREVRAELRKVAWPTKPEVVNYSIIVFVAVVFLTAFIGLLDVAFGNFVIELFE